MEKQLGEFPYNWRGLQILSPRWSSHILEIERSMYEEEDVKYIELYATTFEEDEYSMVTWVQLIGYFFSSRVDK